MSKSLLPSSPAVLGVFDSGVGGLTVLRELARVLPHTHLIYLADSSHAPYGERTDAYVQARALRVVRHLLHRESCQGVVVACNTATAVAIHALRDQWPGVPLVGVEPGIKPAIALSRSLRIGVMATPATLRHPRFENLLRTHAAQAQVIPVPCPGLAQAIEQANEHEAPLHRLLDTFCAPLRAKHVDTVVLGCTHYALVRQQIAQRLGPDVTIIDTALAVAQHTATLFMTAAGPQPHHPPWPDRLTLQATGVSAPLAATAHRYLGWRGTVQTQPLTD